MKEITVTTRIGKSLNYISLNKGNNNTEIVLEKIRREIEGNKYKHITIEIIKEK